MTDPDAAEHSPEQVGPVSPNDNTLVMLRREIRRQGRSGRWTAASMVGIAVCFTILLAVVVPARFAQAFGFANHYPAVVDSVVLSQDQPSPGKVRRNGPRWVVSVRWDDQGTVRRGSESAQAKEPPYQAGEQVEIATIVEGRTCHAFHRRRLGNPGHHHRVFRHLWWDRHLLLAPIQSVAPASCFGHHIDAERVLVQGTPLRHRRRNSRVDVLERGYLVDYAAVDGNADVGSFLLLLAEHGQTVRPDDELDLWSVHIQGPPFAVRRPSDGLWWLGSDSE